MRRRPYYRDIRSRARKRLRGVSHRLAMTYRMAAGSRYAKVMAMLRQSLRLLLLLLLRKLFLGLLDHRLKLSYGGNRGRTESVFCGIPPDRRTVERIVGPSAIKGERIFRWSDFGLRTRAGRRRILIQRDRPMLAADSNAGVDWFHDYWTFVRDASSCRSYGLTVGSPDTDD
jgi:hypothetical protein